MARSCSALDARVALAALAVSLACGGARTPAPLRAAAVSLDAPFRRIVAVGWARGGALWAGNEGAPARGIIEAPGRWSATIAGTVAAMAVDDRSGLVVDVASEASAELRLFDAQRGPQRDAPGVALRASDYVIVADAAACGDGFAIAGSFAGALRVGDASISTAGGRDGFWARVDERGAVRALGRMGGDGDDGLAAVDCRGELTALAGTFSARAEVLGRSLRVMVERSQSPDAAAIVLRGDQLVWARTFGSEREDLAADIALGPSGEVAVVGAVRGEAGFGDVTLVAQGLADGYLARFAPDGAWRGTLRLGGPDYDLATRVLATRDGYLVGGLFTGSADVLGVPLAARGSDDAMLVELRGEHVRATALGGDGREEIVALARTQSGVVLGVAHSAGFVAWGTHAPAPADPLGGAAIVTLSER